MTREQILNILTDNWDQDLSSAIVRERLATQISNLSSDKGSTVNKNDSPGKHRNDDNKSELGVFEEEIRKYAKSKEFEKPIHTFDPNNPPQPKPVAKPVKSTSKPAKKIAKPVEKIKKKVSAKEPQKPTRKGFFGDQKTKRVGNNVSRQKK